jgi:hypothetical protein
MSSSRPISHSESVTRTSLSFIHNDVKKSYLSDEEYRNKFRLTRMHYSDDDSNVVGFWLDESMIHYNPKELKNHRKVLMRLFEYAGLKHPLIRIELHKYDKKTLALLGVIRITTTSDEGDLVVNYRFKAGDYV